MGAGEAVAALTRRWNSLGLGGGGGGGDFTVHLRLSVQQWDRATEGIRAMTCAEVVVFDRLCSAMGGTMTFQEALDARLSLMGVSQKQVESFLADHPPRLSKGAVHDQPASSLSVDRPHLAEFMLFSCNLHVATGAVRSV